MSCDVYANGDEIACKAGGGKVIAAFPDVCLTPPPPPGGPIPVPYPDTSFSKDMKKGSKTVKIENKEIMLKNRSFYKTSPLGDEAATRSQGAGVITHVITGKTYFVSWSMDVLFEGQNVDRHTDLTTSNHASPAANAAVPMVNTAKYSPVQQDAKVPGKHKCESLRRRGALQGSSERGVHDGGAILRHRTKSQECSRACQSPGQPQVQAPVATRRKATERLQ
ncbi:DUF4150 domain-containing protein [Pseudomonas sp. S1_A06]